MPAQMPGPEGLLGLQRSVGNQAVSNLLAGRGRPTVQRDGTPPGGGTPAPAPPAAGQPDAQKEREEKEHKAFDAARAHEGQPAVKVLFSSPSGNKQPPESEQFKVEHIDERPATTTPKRFGFDTQGAATAFADMNAGGTGGVVLKQDEYFFPARLAPGQHELRGLDESKSDVSRWSAFVDWFKTRDHVYRVDPAANSGVVSVTSKDGFKFPIGTDLTPDSQVGISSPQPVDAAGMRAMAGILPEGTKPGQAPPMPDAVAIPADQQDAFIVQYTRARAQEALIDNEQRVLELQKTFGTAPAPGAEPSPVSAAAKAQIDSTRKLGAKYRQILEQEAKLRPIVNGLDFYRDDPSGFSEVTVEKDGKQETRRLNDWASEMDKQLADVVQGKVELMSQAPLLAQLAGGSDPSAWDQSLLAKAPTEANDRAIQAEFARKLEAIKLAIARARTETAGESIRFLFGMQGLRERVKADFARMSGPNATLKDRLSQTLVKFDIDTMQWDFLGQAIMVGLLFVPGGHVIAAVAGFAMAADQMNDAATRLDVSQAAVDPAHALIDQQQAMIEVASATVNLAIAAVALAMAVAAAGKGGKTGGPPGGGGGGGGGKPVFRPLDSGRYVAVGEPSWGTSESTIIQDSTTKERYLFKPVAGEAQVPRAQGVGIAQGDYARRAAAAGKMADLMGVSTPEVELVTWNGREGSLQKWVSNAETLADIKLNDPGRYQQIINSPEYVRLKADIDAFDFAITNIDRGNNAGNLLVEVDAKGKVTKLIPIDNELAFPPSPERAVIRGEAPRLPDKISRATYKHLQDMHNKPDSLRNALKGHLTDPEIEGALRRIDELLKSIDDKAARLGPGGAFTDP